MNKLLLPFRCLLLAVGLPTLSVQAQSPTLDPSFAITSAVGNAAPTFPQILAMVQQPDGKLIVAGDFASINNVPASNVCRLLPNGQVDANFATGGTTDSPIVSIALQTDGKLLVGGEFTTIGGQALTSIARLLPNGTPDPTFVSPLGRTPNYTSQVTKIVIQPGSGILVLGDMIPAGTVTGRFFMARLNAATGARDPSFQPSFNPIYTSDVLVQPGGNLVFAGQPHLIGGQASTVWGTLPNGAIDPAFVPLPGQTTAQGLVRDPATGNLYLAEGNPGTGLNSEPLRLLPNGTRDPSFNTAGAFVAGSQVGRIAQLVVQPNGRLLLGGNLPTTPNDYVGSWRLLPSGARDPSYLPANGPDRGVRTLLVQPDGKLVFGGYISAAGGFGLNCLARMLDPNVLSARVPGPATADELTAWPVPAREVLRLGLPAGRPPRQALLLDALGRVVLRQPLAPGLAAPALPMAGLPPGGYLLRVDFAQGPPAYRRVVLE